jgi:nucleosome binding factor SPN SPT16 subunit
MYDPDELDEEQRERALKQRLNQMFKDFSGKVEKVAEREGYGVQFDVPYRELGFNGCPHKEMVLLQPSVHCLLNLTESPTFVISLQDIEHVHLERVMFSAKNFDLSVIFKDFDKLPHRISAIAMQDLEGIKEWLDDIELTYTSGSTNMNWKMVLKAVKDDDRFYFDTDDDGEKKDVGWDFLKVRERNVLANGVGNTAMLHLHCNAPSSSPVLGHILLPSFAFLDGRRRRRSRGRGER